MDVSSVSLEEFGYTVFKPKQPQYALYEGTNPKLKSRIGLIYLITSSDGLLTVFHPIETFLKIKTSEIPTSRKNISDTELTVDNCFVVKPSSLNLISESSIKLYENSQ